MNIHWLKLAMVAGEEDMRKAQLLKLAEDAIQLQDVNVQWLELEIVTGDEDTEKA